MASLFSSFYTFTVADGWWKYLPQLWGSSSPKWRRPRLRKWYTLFCLEPHQSAVFWVNSQEKKTGSVDACSHPLQTILRLFHNFVFFPPSFSPNAQRSWRSHDCLPLLLHHRWGFLVLAGPCVSRMLLVRNVKLLSRRRYGVLGDRAVLHVPGQVPVTVHRHRSQPGGEVEGQRCSGSDIGDTGVWHHRSIAVSVTAAPSFSFEVQGQGSSAPGFFDLSLHLRREKLAISNIIQEFFL